MLELLRKEQGEDQVTQQQDGKNQGDYGDDVNVHGGLPQLLAGLDVEKRQDEENYREQQHHYILHRRSHSSRRRGALAAGQIFYSRNMLAHAPLEYRKRFLRKA
jgi:hypothetical protein